MFQSAVKTMIHEPEPPPLLSRQVHFNAACLLREIRATAQRLRDAWGVSAASICGCNTAATRDPDVARYWLLVRRQLTGERQTMRMERYPWGELWVRVPWSGRVMEVGR